MDRAPARKCRASGCGTGVVDAPPTGMDRESLLVIGAEWLTGKPIAIRSRRTLVIAVGLATILGVWGYLRLREVARPLTLAARAGVPHFAPDHGDVRFGVPLAKRREVFTEVAGGEPSARAEGTKAFPGADKAWSAEDHRGAYERKNVAAAAARHHLTLSQVYMILDEGIRAKWPGPDGEPLKPSTVPLHPRRDYGW